MLMTRKILPRILSEYYPTVPNVVEAFSRETVRSYPKAGPRKQSQAERNKRKAAILTDTPEKNALEEEESKTIKKRKDKKIVEEKKEKSVSKKTPAVKFR